MSVRREGASVAAPGAGTTTTLAMKARTRAGLALALACIVLAAGAAHAQNVPRMRKLTVASQSFSIDYPEKDWSLVPGGNAMLVAIAQRRFEAVLLVERSTLQVALSDEEIGDVFLSVEAEHIRESSPSATDIKADLQQLGDRRVAAFVYRRNGVLGPERVLQYSMPAGTSLYRIIAVAKPESFDRHLPALQAMAASLAPM